MNHLEGLLLAVSADPDDDLARLALADLLEEFGDPRSLWARERDLWRWSRPDLADPLPRMLDALSSCESADAIVRGCARLGPACLDALLPYFDAGHETWARATAARAAAEVFPVERLPELGRMLRDGPTGVRSAAAAIIQSLGKRALPLLPDVLPLLEPGSRADGFHLGSVLAAMGPLPEGTFETVRALYDACGDSPEEQRRRDDLASAAAHCGEAGQRFFFEANADLLAMFDDPPTPRRLERLAAVASVDESAEGETALLGLLRDDDHHVRFAAASALAGRAEISTATAVTLAEATYPRRIEGDAHHTALAPHAERRPEAVEALRRKLRTAPSAGADDVVSFLRRHGRRLTTLLPDVAAALDAELATPSSGCPSAVVLVAMGEDGVRAVLARLPSAHPHARPGLLAALGNAAALPAAALPVLDDAFGHECVLTRTFAAPLFAKLPTPAETRLLAALRDPSALVRKAAAEALAGDNITPAAADALARCCRGDDDTKVRAAAIRSLLVAGNGDSKTLDIARASLADGDAALRLEAVKACGERGVRSLRPEVETRRDDASAAVRAEAEKLLAAWAGTSDGA